MTAKTRSWNGTKPDSERAEKRERHLSLSYEAIIAASRVENLGKELPKADLCNFLSNVITSEMRILKKNCHKNAHTSSPRYLHTRITHLVN